MPDPASQASNVACLAIGERAQPAAQLTPRWNLFLTGFLVLFLELACIRWFAAYVPT
ncbi:MAG: hypothetical protein ACYSVY_24855 [Planctomycetota bacterium]|jgi:hypothetical protein